MKTATLSDGTTIKLDKTTRQLRAIEMKIIQREQDELLSLELDVLADTVITGKDTLDGRLQTVDNSTYMDTLVSFCAQTLAAYLPTYHRGIYEIRKYTPETGQPLTFWIKTAPDKRILFSLQCLDIPFEQDEDGITLLHANHFCFLLQAEVNASYDHVAQQQPPCDWQQYASTQIDLKDYIDPNQLAGTIADLACTSTYH